MKIIDKIKEHEVKGVPFFSLEYFPPKTDVGIANLYDRLDRMKILGPEWIDVTWGAGGSTSKLTLDICSAAQKYLGLDTMMHLTCTNMPVEEIVHALNKAKEAGIHNILALRGDPPKGEEWKKIEGGFANAVDLVKFIRKEHGSYFGIAVAGYPEKHSDAVSYEADIRHLKEKVDAGADVVVTQLFYDVDIFLKFVSDCKALGIMCPILPGIMPIHTYQGFKNMTTFCKTSIPNYIHEALEPIKSNDEAVKAYGVKLGIDMCTTLLKSGVHGLHFYTLNLEKSVTEILKGLGLWKDASMENRYPLPWQSSNARPNEDVRPVFWQHRPKSYMDRTLSWDEFPNGRWGDSRSPAFGDLSDFHLGTGSVVDKAWKPLEVWGSPVTEAEIFEVFAKYCRGEISRLPWNEFPLSPESQDIKEQLVKINKLGFLTTNSQPAVNGKPSSDEKYGWGPKGGFVYQKAYLEFFTSPGNLETLLHTIAEYPTLTYHAVNLKGDKMYSNNQNHVTALTWGVFPNKEIVQPTIVDPQSFVVWKGEAFALWRSSWASLYPPESESRKLLEAMTSTYFLVNIVDHDYIAGDKIFKVFEQVGALFNNGGGKSQLENHNSH